jgi:DDE superfamily endonuclease
MCQPLCAVLTTPSFSSLLTLLTGWVFASQHTVTAMIKAAGALGPKHFTCYHRLLSLARWSRDELGLQLFQLLLPLCSDVILLTVDDTLCRKFGRKRMFGCGMHRDAISSSRNKTIVNWGHNWVILAVVVRLPLCKKRVFSLPVLCRLYLSHKACERWRLCYRSQPALCVQMLKLLCERFPTLRFHLLGDSTYGAKTVLAELPANCGLTSRLPLRARIYDPPPQREPGCPGRPRKRGAKRPTPEQMLQGRCDRTTLRLYGRKHKVRLASCLARWHQVPNTPLRVVAVEPLSGPKNRQVFYSTDVRASARAVLTGYSYRWSLEETIRAAKSELGMRQPPGWSKQAVQRTAPLALSLYTLVVLWFAQVGAAHYRPPNSPWYLHKRQPSFTDMLRTLKVQSLEQWISQHVEDPRERENLRHLLDCVVPGAA